MTDLATEEFASSYMQGLVLQEITRAEIQMIVADILLLVDQVEDEETRNGLLKIAREMAEVRLKLGWNIEERKNMF